MKLIIEEYIDKVEISKEGIRISYQQGGDELIQWDDERIKEYLPT